MHHRSSALLARIHRNGVSETTAQHTQHTHTHSSGVEVVRSVGATRGIALSL